MRFFFQGFLAPWFRAGAFPAALVTLALAPPLVSRVHAAPTLYLTSSGIASVSGLWTVNTSTGIATYVGPILDAGGSVYVYSGGLAYDTSSHTLYATGDSFLGVSNLYTINPATGAATVVGPAGAARFGTSGLAYDPATHKLYAVARSSGSGEPPSFFEVNPSTGAATLIGAPVGAGTILSGAGLDPVSGILYANGTDDFLATPSKLFSVNKATGVQTAIGPHGLSLGRQMYYGGIAFEPGTNTCYANGSVSASEAGLYVLDRATGAATLVGSFGPGAGGSDGGLAFIPDATTGVEPLPRAGAAFAAGPNPFRRRTTLAYTLRKSANVGVELFNVMGHRTATLFAGRQDPGEQHVTWDETSGGFDAPAGVYFARLVIDRRVEATLKLVHLRD